MKKLIIGCGYVGRRLAAHWHQQGHEVFATTRKSHHAAEFLALGWQPVLFDLLNPVAELPLVDVVVIAVGFDRASGRTMREVYVDGLRQVLPRLSSTAKVLYVSSTSVYGQTAGELVDESSETAPEEMSGKVVLEAEGRLRDLCPREMILRFAGIYGPGRLLREKAIRAGEPIAANPDRWLNLIHVDDGVRAIEAAELRGRQGRVYNIADDEPVRRIEFFTELARQLGAPAPRFEPVSEGATPPHERTNRRIDNRCMHDELNVDLQFPTYRKGLSVSVCKI